MAIATQQSVRESVAATVADIIDDFKDQPDTDREELIERLDEECDSLFGQLAYDGPISQWDASILAEHAGDCAAIIATAKKDAWVEDDSGLWEVVRRSRGEIGAPGTM